MAQRDYKGVQIAQGQSVMPTVAGQNTQRSAGTANVQPNIATQALSGLLSIGSSLAKKSIDVSAETAYIEGQRKAATSASTEDLNQDFLTKGFTNGGYNIQNYRMEQAELAAEMSAFIAKDGKSLSPTEFSKVLANKAGEKFSELSDTLSQGDKVRALAGQAQLEQNIMGQHNSAHKANAIERVAQLYTIQGNQINGAMTAARNSGDRVAYSEAAARASLYVNDVLTGESLPGEMRSSVAVGYLKSILATDNAAVVEDLRDSGQLDGLSAADRTALDNGIRESKSRTRARDNLGNLEANAQFMTSVGKGTATIEGVREHVGRNVENGLMTAAAGEAVYEQFYASQSDTETLFNAMEALDSGDVNALGRMGLGTEEALLMQDQHWALQGIPQQVRVLRGLEQGMRLGVVPKQLGQHVGNAITAIASNPENANPEQLALLNGVIASTSQLKLTNAAAATTLLSGIPEAQRNVLSYAMRVANLGVGPAEAIKTATGNTEAFQAMGAARQTKVTGKLQEAVDGLIKGQYGNSWNSDFSRNNAVGLDNLLPNAGRFSEDQFRMRVQTEIQRLADDPDNLSLFGTDDQSVESLADVAVANVTARTVRVAPTRDSKDATPLVMPRGVSTAAYFGTEDTARVGQALYEQYKPRSAENFGGFTFDTSNGNLLFKETNADGIVLEQTVVDHKAIGASVQKMRSDIINEASDASFGRSVPVRRLDAAVQAGADRLGGAIDATVGEGTAGTQSVGTGAGEPTVDVRIDGNNTAGVSRLGTFRWRQDLLGAEGLRLKVYKDSLGNNTVGVGELVGDDMNVGDEVPIELAESMFQASTDEALNAGVRISRDLGVQDEGAKLGLAAAVFQLGERGLGKFQKTAAAIKAKDWDAFSTEIRNSDWYEQTPKRVLYFEEQMKSHFNQ